MFNFQEALAVLTPEATFKIANEARTPADYYLASILPERGVASFHVDSGSITVKSVMAGLVAMDSPYPGGTFVEVSHFTEQTLKIANENPLSEKAQRELYNFLQSLQISGGSTTEAMITTLLNFYNKVIIQPHFDTMEWLRAQALTTGLITATFNNKTVSVDYGVPVANKPATRTGNDAYHGSTSKFWTDYRTMMKALGYKITAFLANTTTIDAIITNDTNKVIVLEQDSDNGIFKITRHVGSIERESSDKRDLVTLIGYNREYEVLNPETNATTKKTFIPDGTLFAVGGDRSDTFRIGEGSTNDPETNASIGYTHIAPTNEGGNAVGRWGKLYQPQGEEYKIVGKAVTNGLPVIENPKKLFILTTEMPS